MINKPLIAGVVGFLLGGLLVSIAATTFDKPADTTNDTEVSMSQMTEMLKPLQGDAYDRTFIEHMIDHHQAAIDMAHLSETRAKHQEIKDLSLAIIAAQEKEITDMKAWQKLWGYADSSNSQMNH
jgi:uncharacterized protein (DUF305 family)